MSRASTKFGAVLRKSFLIKKKSPISTFVEFFVPVIILGLLVLLKDRFPSAQSFNNLFNILLSSTFAVSVSSLIALVVSEREQRISEMMKILGLPAWLYYSSWFVFYTIMMTAMTVCLSAILVYGGLMPDSNVVVVFLFYFLFSVSSVSFALALSTPFNSAKVAQNVGMLLYGMMSVFGLVVTPDWSSGTKRAVTFVFPPLAYSMGLSSVSLSGKMDWSSISEEVRSYSLQTSMLMMAASTVVYFALFVYLDQVLPHSVGSKSHWLFPIRAFAGKRKKESCLPLAQAKDDKVIEIQALSKQYSRSARSALSEVTLKLVPGEFTVLLGQNGAGKTTLINILTGMTEASSGDARVFGYSVGQNLREVRENLGFCPQHDIQWPQLTIAEHFEILGAFKGLGKSVIQQRMNELLNLLGLSGKLNAPVSTLSGGMKRKLSVALSFLGDSKFLILDEPTSGLDPLSRRAMWTFLGKMRDNRVVLLSTHYMDEAEALGERVIILSEGQVRANGTVKDLRVEYDCGYEILFSATSGKSLVADDLRLLAKPGRVVSVKGGGCRVVVSVKMEDSDGISSILKKFNDTKLFDDKVGIKSKRLDEVLIAIALAGSPGLYDACKSSTDTTRYLTSGLGLLASQIIGTLIKRLRMFLREPLAAFIQNITPLMTLGFGLLIVKHVGRGRKLDVEAIGNFLDDMLLVFFLQIAYSAVSTAIVTSMSRESLSSSKFLQYVSGLTPLAYWLGSFMGDVFEYFCIPFLYTSALLLGLDVSIPVRPLLALLAAFGPGVIAQSYLLTVLVRNATLVKFVSLMLNFFVGFGLPVLFTALRFSGEYQSALQIAVPVCRLIPTFNLGDGIFSLTIFKAVQILIKNALSIYGASTAAQARRYLHPVYDRFPAAGANSAFDYAVVGGPIIWLLAATPVLLATAILLDDLRYKHKLGWSRKLDALDGKVEEDESVRKERLVSGESHALRAVNVSKQWVARGPLAVDRVALAVARNGEIFTLLGENGAGKTTLMTLGIGQILPSDGDIYVDKFNTKNELKNARQLIGYCPQFDALLLSLTVKDHLSLFARIKGIESSSIDPAVDRIIDWVGLASFANAKAKTLSGGYQRRLSLAIALMGRPEILILDEPSCGMDPVARRQMWKVMKAASRDFALILSTHSMEEAEAVSTRLGIMSRGRMMCIGTADELREKFSNGIEVSAKVHPQAEGSELLHVLGASKGSLQYVVEKLGSSEPLLKAFSDWLEQADLLRDFDNSLVVSEVEVSGPSIRCVVTPVKKDVTSDFLRCVFGLLEKLKQSGHVLEYSVSQNSLDQVFRSIASRPLD